MAHLHRRSSLAVFTLLIAAAPVRGDKFADWSTPLNLGRVVNGCRFLRNRFERRVEPVLHFLA